MKMHWLFPRQSDLELILIKITTAWLGRLFLMQSRFSNKNIQNENGQNEDFVTNINIPQSDDFLFLPGG